MMLLRENSPISNTLIDLGNNTSRNTFNFKKDPIIN